MRFTRTLAILCLLTSAVWAEGFETPALDPGPAPWTTLEQPALEDSFVFAIVPDRTGGNRPGPFREAMKRLNALGPDFTICVGDLIEGYSEDGATIREEWDELDGIVQGLRMPFFYVPGNHDLTNDTMLDAWRERYGLTYYHFRYGDCLFLVLNSEDPPDFPGGAHFGEEQIAHFKQVIADNTDVRWTFLFFHQPVPVDAGAASPLYPIEQALGERPYTVFMGHYHSYAYQQYNNRDYIICASAGAGSSLAGPLLGSFDHVLWIRVDDSGPDITNLLLNGMYGRDVLKETCERMRRKLNADTSFFQVSSVVLGKSARKPISLTLTAENTQPVNMLVTGAFEEHPVFTVSPVDFEAGLVPGDDEACAITLKAKVRDLPETVPPLRLTATATFYLPNGDEIPVVMEREVPIYARYGGDQWDFEDGAGAWEGANQVSLAGQDGVLRATSSGEDPFMRVDVKGKGAVGPLEAVFRVRATKDEYLLIFWSTEAESGETAQRSAGAKLTGDGEYHEIVVPFEANSRLTTLRVDPGESPGLVEIDSISLRAAAKKE